MKRKKSQSRDEVARWAVEKGLLSPDTMNRGDSPSKHKNKRTVVDGHNFASQAEAAYYLRLKQLRESGEVLAFLRQVPFDLPGRVRYLADFLVQYPDRIEVVDVKGLETDLWKLKWRLLEEERYPWVLKAVRAVYRNGIITGWR